MLPHHAELLTASAISREVAKSRGYRSVGQKARLTELGFSSTQARVPALLIPIWNVHGEIALYQTRADQPRIVDGKAVKYEIPRGSRMVLDVPPPCQRNLGNPGVPLFVTEGVRKADAAASAGLCCIGLLGVWNWRGTNEHGGKVALADWESIALNDRVVYVVFDSDVMTKPGVHAALARLKPFLEGRGAHVRVVYLPLGPDGSKVGLDDYLAAGHTLDDLLALATTELRTPGRQPEFQPIGGAVGTLLERTGEELLIGPAPTELPSIPFLGRAGYVLQGWSHLVSGYPRVGKTDLLVQCAADWLSLGHEVLYVTEEPEILWRARLHALVAHRPNVPWAQLKVVFGLGADPSAMQARVFSGPEANVILDAVRNLLGIVDENDNSAVARVLNPWVAAARAATKTLIVAHHQRKGGGEHGEGIAGGHAFLGIFDVALEVLRDPQARNSNRRLVRAYARVIGPPELLYERTDEGAFRALGDPGAVRLDDVQERLLQILSGDGQTTKECHEALDEPQPSLEQVRLALLTLARAGRVDRDPPLERGDARGHTVRWAVANAVDETSNARPSKLELDYEAQRNASPRRETQVAENLSPDLVDLPIEEDYPRSAWDPNAGDDDPGPDDRLAGAVAGSDAGGRQ